MVAKYISFASESEVDPHRMIDTNVKTSIIQQKIKIVVCLFFHIKMEQDNIKTKIESSIIDLREIYEEKQQGFKDPPNILSYEFGLFLTHFNGLKFLVDFSNSNP